MSFGLLAAVSSCLVAAPAIAKPADAPVTRLASPNPGSVNTLLVRAPRGIVIVDGGRNRAGGARAVRRVRRLGRPVAAILVTHSHPDHVGGLGKLHRAFPSAPIFASRRTAFLMRNDPQGFYDLARRNDPDFPVHVVPPTRVFGSGAVVRVGGLRFRTAEFADGESQTATVYYLRATRTLFGGDLTADRVTPALIEGHTCGWLTNLRRLERRFPGARTVHPGHGAAAPFPAQLRRQRSYLQTIRRLVAPAVTPASPQGTTLTDAEQGSIAAEMRRRYPHAPPVATLPDLLEVDIKAVAEELAASDPVTLPAACRDPQAG